MSAFHPGCWQKNVEQAKNYFSEMMADYHSERGKELGRWGPGAAALGLSGEVIREHFCRLVDGRHPMTGEQLTQRQREDRRCYLGTVLSAPKSFSIAAVLGQDERLVAMFNAAVAETMDIAAGYGAARVRAKGRDEDALTGNMVYALFTHDISRALDPALHTHSAVFNVSQLKEGAWKALQTAPLFERQRLFSEILLGKLAAGARNLGYSTVQTKDGFEMAGISQELIDKFSKGKAKIDAEIAGVFGTTGEKGHAARRAIAAHNVRDAKTDVAAKDLMEKWRLEMGDQAYHDLTTLVAGARKRQPSEDPQIAPSTALSLAVSHLTERTSVVVDHQVQAEALAAGRGQVDLEAIKLEMEKPERRLIFGRPDVFGSRKLTTKELLEAESLVLAFARSGVGQCLPLLPHVNLRARDPLLSDEQKQAVDTILKSRDRVMLLLGKAGTGKSTSQRDLVAGIKLAGHSAVGCAPQARQVAELRDMGLTECKTLAAVLEKGELPNGAVVILDEAGQVGSRDFARLVEMVEKVNGRLILSGDIKQHGAVCAGDMLRLLAHNSGCARATIRTIRRQKDEMYKAAVEKLSRHQSLDAWDMLDSAGKVEEIPGDERRKALAEWVATGLGEGKNVLTVAPTWAEIDRVTHAIRDQLILGGRLGTETKRVFISERIDFTTSQKKQSRCYEPDMEIIERRGLGLPKKRMKIKRVVGDKLILVSDENTTELQLDLTRLNPKSSWTVHRPREIEIRVGDRLLLQQNDRPHGYTNGDLVTVIGLHDDEISLSNGKAITNDYTQFTHGWVVTSYASQGLTCDRVAVSYDQGSYGGIDRRGLYVAVSRGREDVRIFTDDRDFVRDCLRRNTGERTTATELVASVPKPNAGTLWRKRQKQLVAAHGESQANEAIEALKSVAEQQNSPHVPNQTRSR